MTIIEPAAFEGRSPAADRPRHLTEPRLVRGMLIALALLFLGVLLVLPLIVVFTEALQKGVKVYAAAITEREALSAVRLTLAVAAIAVPLNALFGLAAAWAVTRFTFPGKNALVTLIDLPFSVSPVIAGLMIVLLYGAHGIFGPWLAERGLQIVFAFPGLVLATVFVTFPFVARELIPTMQALGTAQEEAALTLGAGGLRTFWRVTLPNVRWALLYGLVMTNARAMGEFGAVSVVSGHIRGQTNTIPLHVEILYNEYRFTAAFAMASLLALLALVTLGIRQSVERRHLRRAGGGPAGFLEGGEEGG